MSTVMEVFRKVTTIAMIIAAIVLLIAACGPNASTCNANDMSNRCLVLSDNNDPVATGSIQPQRMSAREQTGSPPPVIYAPATRRSDLDSVGLDRMVTLRQSQNTRARLMRHGLASSCDITGSIPSGRAGAFVHLVRPGETLLGIARRYDASVVEIVRLNHIQDYRRIRSGALLLVPRS